MLLLVSMLAAATAGVQVGDRVHITGCNSAGKLTRTVVKLWERQPNGQFGRAVSEVFGANQTRRWPDVCSGEVVIIRERQTATIAPLVRYKVEAVIGGAIGWVAQPYIGKSFPVEKCEAVFSDQPPATRARCKGVK